LSRGRRDTPVAGPGEFTYVTARRRVVFAHGASRRLAEELERLGCERVLLVTTPGRLAGAPQVVDALGRVLAGIFDGARAHVPLPVLREALEQARRSDADACVALGGGSAIGVAKGIALEAGLPVVAVPTTFSGSEMTSVWGITDGDRKRTGRDPRVAARTVVYDPVLVESFRGRPGAASGMNAVAHCVEALYAVDGNPVSGLLAEEGIRILAGALSALGSGDEAAGSAAAQALLGAHLAGSALDMTSMGLHHKLCHVLGGMFALPHALVHAILLPYVTAFNAGAAPEAVGRVTRALEKALGRPAAPAEGVVAAAPRALFEFNRGIGIAATLGDLGLGDPEVGRVADAVARAAAEGAYRNPAPVTREGVHALLDAARRGDRPGPVLSPGAD
jgi:maleylacetate reductase